MGFLSSLFQGSTPQPVAGPAISASGIPKELAPYYKDIMGKAQALYNERTAEGYKPYSGPTMADFTPEQKQAQAGISGLVGSQAPVFDEAMNLTRSAATPMTQDQMTTYMSPYQQAVTDIEKREATKQYESQVVPQLAAQAAATGGFGGSRQAILEGMAADTQQRLLGDIQAKGSQSAYQDAVSRFNTDRQAQGQAGAQLATMAPNQFKAQLGEFGALQTVGEEQQKQSQTALDEAFRQYQLERDDPYNTMSKYQSVVTGAPVQTTQFAQPTPPQPSIGQQLIGGLGTLATAYGAFGGKMPKLKEGGGIADNLPVVYRQEPGKVLTARDLVRRPNESVMAFGARVNKQKRIDQGLDPVETIEVVDNAKEVASEAMDDGQGITAIPIERANMQGPSKKFIPPHLLKKSNVETIATVGKEPEVIEDIVVAPPIESRGIRDILNEVSGGTYEKGRDKTVTATELDPTGIDNLKAISLEQQKKINAFIEVNKNRMSTEDLNKEIEKQFTADELALTNFQKNERDLSATQRAEDAKERSQYFSSKEADASDAYSRQQYGNLAQFFARLGTATPTSSGIGGLLGAGLQAADETLPQAMQTRKAYDDSLESIDYSKRSEAKEDKRISRTEEKSLRKELFSGKKELTKTKREKLKKALTNDVEIAQANIAAGNMKIEIAGEIVNAETLFNKSKTELRLLELDLNKATDLGKIFPDYESLQPALQREIGGDIFEGLPTNDALLEGVLSKAYNDVISEISSMDQTISQENLPRGTVMAAILERAKDLLRQQKKPDPNAGAGDGTGEGTESGALASDLLEEETD